MELMEVVEQQQPANDAVMSSAVLAILSTINPEEVTFRQIRDKLRSDFNINAEGRKEFVLSVIEKFFSGEADGNSEVSEEEPHEQEDTGVATKGD
jgi:hypothetical protein